MTATILKAPAKLNVYLHIIGKNSDGMHILESGVTFLDLCDVIHLTPNNLPHDTLNVSGAFAEAAGGGRDNLILRALAAVRELGVSNAFFYDVKLIKNIPCGAGLGGGSADAAAIFRYFFPNPDENVVNKAARLGADVPVCITPTHDYVMAGIGDKTAKTRRRFIPRDRYVLVACPPVHSSTPTVFKRYGELRSLPALAPEDQKRVVADALSPRNTALNGGFHSFAGQRNDLEAAAPCETIEIIRRLSTMPGAALARMTGSGSACFAIFTSKTYAEGAKEALLSTCPNIFAAICMRFYG